MLGIGTHRPPDLGFGLVFTLNATGDLLELLSFNVSVTSLLNGPVFLR